MKAFFLFLNTHSVNIFNGVKVSRDKRGEYIQLPEIPNVEPEKFKVFLDYKNPAVVKNDRIHEIFLVNYGSMRFRDAVRVTACKPTKDSGKIAIFAWKRWVDLGLEIISGRPNGEFPGVQLLSEGDTIAFTHAGIKYQLTHDGEGPFISPVKKPKATPAVKQAKPEKPTEKVDNRQKVGGVKVVDKVELPEPKKAPETSKSPQQVAKTKSAAKQARSEKLKEEDSYVVGGGIIHHNKPASFSLGEMLKAANVRLSKS